MSQGRRDRYAPPSSGRGRTSEASREEKRRRFEDGRGPTKRSGGGLRPATVIAIGAIVVGVAFIMVMTFAGKSSPGAIAASVVQQIPATTAATQGGKVSVSAQEVAEKKLVYWDYKEGGKNVPLLAYVTPSGAMKLAARLCEPCKGYSFRVEGSTLICNTCGTKWDLESSKGISGGCLDYPPEVLPSSLADGKLVGEEAKIASWKPRA